MKHRRWQIALLVASACAVGCIGLREDWRTASREPVGLAPVPALTPEPVIQVYAARAVGWRGYFGVHSWIAVKPAEAADFTVYEVSGWRLRRSGSALAVRQRQPDARWYGAAPELLSDVRGPGAAALIERIDVAAHSYPYSGRYRVWPGPNSNTFTAHVLRAVPELRVDLPPTAIGKDYLGARPFAAAPSGTGYQLSLFGMLGVLAGGTEGLEINLLGLTFGVDPFDPAFKAPMIGRLGPQRDTAPVIVEAVAPVGAALPGS